MRELKCLRCGTMMEYKGTKEFQLGHDSFSGDSHLWAGSVKYAAYECPECGKAELYKPNEEETNDSEVTIQKADRSVLRKARRMGF